MYKLKLLGKNLYNKAISIYEKKYKTSCRGKRKISLRDHYHKSLMNKIQIMKKCNNEGKISPPFLIRQMNDGNAREYKFKNNLLIIGLKKKN